MYLEFTANNVSVTPGSNSYFDVEVNGADEDAILDGIGVDKITRWLPIGDAIDAYDAEELLEAIGKDKAAEYFGLVEAE